MRNVIASAKIAAAVLAVVLAAGLAHAEREAADYPHGEYRGDCSLCHGLDGWTPLEPSPDFDHANFGYPDGFPLDGAHAALECRACHLTLDFTKTRSTCAECHQDVHRGELGRDCKRCHTTRSFVSRAEMARNHATTRFPLTGAHKALDCRECHSPARGAQVWALSVECVSCHRPAFDGAKDPDHRGGGFPVACESCHTTASWAGAKFDHDATRFPLTGAHRTVTCQQCHADGVYAGKSTACVSCHQSDYAGTTDPNHRQAGYSTDCTTCHTTTTWTGATFDHDATQFPLTGAHRAATCQQCHADGVYAGKSTACVSCHQSDYDGTTDPNHRQAGYSTDCTTCHTTTTWTGATFDHDATRFPLTGAHRALLCSDCHADGVYAGKSTACVSCHQSDYDGTTNPNHRQAGYGTDCTTCHTTTTWAGATFDHDATRFPLTGAHRALLCSDCHADGVYAGRSIECVSCHQSDYDQAVDPNHRAAGFPTDCAQCHNTTAWTGARFDHDATYFPIYSGKHQGKWTACSDCHTNPSNYAVFECILCHAHSDEANYADKHSGVPGYSYDSQSCYRCHPSGRAG